MAYRRADCDRLVIITSNYPSHVLNKNTSFFPQERMEQKDFFDQLRPTIPYSTAAFPCVVIPDYISEIRIHARVSLEERVAKNESEIVRLLLLLESDDPSRNPLLDIVYNCSPLHRDSRRISPYLPHHHLIPLLFSFNSAAERHIEKVVAILGYRKSFFVDIHHPLIFK